MKTFQSLGAALLALLASLPALADVNIGVTLSLTGPASGLGIPVGNQFKLWPQTIAGEKVNLIILDDASDPGKGVGNARRFVTDDKVDMIFGGSITTVSAAIAPVAAEAKTTQISIAPVGVPPDQERWVFRLPQGFTVMAHPIVEHMKKSGVKTVGFLGYTDAYGESWLKEFTAQAEKAGIKVVAAERFARSDTSVTPQALKLVVGQPRRDAGRGLGLRRRDAAQGDHRARLQGQGLPDARRGHARPGAHRRQGRRGRVSSSPARPWWPSNCPTAIRRRQVAVDFVTNYEKAYGAGLAQPVRRPRLRREDHAREDPAGGAEEGQARHARVPRRAARRGRGHGPHDLLARRDELDRRPTTGATPTRPA